MRGGDQSANLGGMLSQIGETVGGMGKAFEPITIAATKPRGDMDDPDHVQRMAEWAARSGDTTSAQMYASQARDMAKEDRAKKTAASMNTATSAYAKALESGDPTKIDTAYNALQSAASSNGQDAFARVSAVDKDHATKKAQADQAAETLRVNKERAAQEAVSVKMNGATAEEISEIVKNADPSVAMYAQRMGVTRAAYLASEEKTAQTNKLNQQSLDLSFHIDPALPDEVKEQLAGEQEALQAEADKYFVNGTWLPNTRNEISQKRQKLADKAYYSSSQLHNTEQAQTNIRTGEYRRLTRDIERQFGSPDEREVIERELKEDNEWLVNDDEEKWSEQAITNEWRRQQRKSADKSYPDVATWPGAPAIGTIEGGFEYTGGDPAKKSSYKAVEDN